MGDMIKELYQISVVGECDCVSDVFKAHSKKVYMHYPTKEEIDEFIKTCTSGQFINLKADAPYKTIVTKLEIIE